MRQVIAVPPARLVVAVMSGVTVDWTLATAAPAPGWPLVTAALADGTVVATTPAASARAPVLIARRDTRRLPTRENTFMCAPFLRGSCCERGDWCLRMALVRLRSRCPYTAENQLMPHAP